MAKYPIVVVKENPGTQESGGKLVVEVQWLEEGSENRAQILEMKLPKVIGAVRNQAELNGVKVETSDRKYTLELGERDVDIEGADTTQC